MGLRFGFGFGFGLGFSTCGAAHDAAEARVLPTPQPRTAFHVLMHMHMCMWVCVQGVEATAAKAGRAGGWEPSAGSQTKEKAVTTFVREAKF